MASKKRRAKKAKKAFDTIMRRPSGTAISPEELSRLGVVIAPPPRLKKTKQPSRILSGQKNK